MNTKQVRGPKKMNVSKSDGEINFENNWPRVRPFGMVIEQECIYQEMAIE